MLVPPDGPEAFPHQLPAASTDAFPGVLWMPRTLPVMLHPLMLTVPVPLSTYRAVGPLEISHVLSTALAASTLTPPVLVTRAENSRTAEGAVGLPIRAPRPPPGTSTLEIVVLCTNDPGATIRTPRPVISVIVELSTCST